MTGDENHTENKEVKRVCGKHGARSFSFGRHSTCWLPTSNENAADEEGESGVDLKTRAQRRGRSEREREREREREGGKMTLWINCPSCWKYTSPGAWHWIINSNLSEKEWEKSIDGETGPLMVSLKGRLPTLGTFCTAAGVFGAVEGRRGVLDPPMIFCHFIINKKGWHAPPLPTPSLHHQTNPVCN